MLKQYRDSHLNFHYPPFSPLVQTHYSNALLLSHLLLLFLQPVPLSLPSPPSLSLSSKEQIYTSSQRIKSNHLAFLPFTSFHPSQTNNLSINQSLRIYLELYIYQYHTRLAHLISSHLISSLLFSSLLYFDLALISPQHQRFINYLINHFTPCLPTNTTATQTKKNQYVIKYIHLSFFLPSSPSQSLTLPPPHISTVLSSRCSSPRPLTTSSSTRLRQLKRIPSIPTATSTTTILPATTSTTTVLPTTTSTTATTTTYIRTTTTSSKG
ncbi:hypothetical protein Kpol_1045p71 [Vanderwaltozyma polyspora DSM 70294]|uniref:Uncharacterized protein n=1 Tax=Vanderwaltozyma polyspora (strain ATCC 22028 / DSM 70294 / BCRC 21397 / CBS 2163 / NBRC 10782 / NRRL Y-8283 / UCD 57-17) TaxID=436907 RepID=A7TI77_VANPO|nr:uncharacterized protein Kpol_1045p71 [Vanderwaltozyma polyspora DSM 70294]EDO18084.1 hypothetical protein Kpol_1045p71 [Vanderwaltozyma polyspora DSM 70294]